MELEYFPLNSMIFQCKHCPRVFESVVNLERHARCRRHARGLEQVRLSSASARAGEFVIRINLDAELPADHIDAQCSALGPSSLEAADRTMLAEAEPECERKTQEEEEEEEEPKKEWPSLVGLMREHYLRARREPLCYSDEFAPPDRRHSCLASDEIESDQEGRASWLGQNLQWPRDGIRAEEQAKVGALAKRVQQVWAQISRAAESGRAQYKHNKSTDYLGAAREAPPPPPKTCDVAEKLNDSSTSVNVRPPPQQCNVASLGSGLEIAEQGPLSSGPAANAEEPPGVEREGLEEPSGSKEELEGKDAKEEEEEEREQELGCVAPSGQPSVCQRQTTTRQRTETSSAQAGAAIDQIGAVESICGPGELGAEGAEGAGAEAAGQQTGAVSCRGEPARVSPPSASVDVRASGATSGASSEAPSRPLGSKPLKSILKWRAQSDLHAAGGGQRRRRSLVRFSDTPPPPPPPPLLHSGEAQAS